MPGTVKTTLNYYPSSGFKEMQLGTLEMFRRPFDPREVEVMDIRGRDADFHLDTHGFTLHSHVSRYIPFAEASSVVEDIYPETELLLKTVTGATRVNAFSHLIRNVSFEEMQRKATTTLPGSKLAGNVAPARAVHIDQSTSGAHDILRDNLSPDEAEQFQKTRWAIINVWRPLEPVRRDPLGLCDARTVNEEDLVDVQTHLPSSAQDKYKSLSKGASFGSFRVKYSECHRWYYVSGMTPQEVLLIKIFDSKVDERIARRTPHSSFSDPCTDPGLPPRSSLEVRCLVYFEEEKP